MVSLPIICSSCGKKRWHYSHCDCPDGQLWWIDQRRESLRRELAKLDDKERKILGLKTEAAELENPDAPVRL